MALDASQREVVCHEREQDESRGPLARPPDRTSEVGREGSGFARCIPVISNESPSLPPHEGSIVAVQFHKLLMGPLFSDSSCPQHDDDVGVHDGRKPVCYDEGRAPPHEVVKRILYLCL